MGRGGVVAATEALTSMHARDTSPEARRIVLEALRRASPAQRLEMAVQQTELLWKLVWAGVVHELPLAPEDERRARFLERWLGKSIATELRSAPRPGRPEHDRSREAES